MNKILIMAAASIALVGCEYKVNGYTEDSFIANCRNKGGVAIATAKPSQSSSGHSGYFCIKKDAVLNHTSEY